MAQQEPASSELVANLFKYTGCRQQDLAACRGYVRQLTRDLPAFDSIWLDALVQKRRLSPFQADCLAKGEAARLQVGKYQLVSPLMLDRTHRRYLGRNADTGEQVLIEQHRLSDGLTETKRAALIGLQEKMGRLDEGSGIRNLIDFEFDRGNLFAIYPYRPGLTVRELLIRRGRFPETLIRVLTPQLLTTLKQLAELGVVHGDLRAANLVLRPDGQIDLLNTGLRQCLTPHWTVQTELPLESYDTLAPDVVKTGEWSSRADRYSAGCLLWQMACGRPPLHSADPLLKLKAHFTRSIPDVREYAPDVDAETASQIFRLTRRPGHEINASEDEPGAFQNQRLPARRAIRRFVNEFEQLQPGGQSPRSFRWQPAQVLVPLLICAMSLGLWWAVTGRDPISVTSSWLMGPDDSAVVSETHNGSPAAVGLSITPASTTTQQAQRSRLELPAIDEIGRLVLKAGQYYRADVVSTVGPLQIVVVDDAGRSSSHNAVVEVDDTAWQIWATELSLANVTVRYVGPSEQEQTRPESLSPPAALLIAQSLNLTATGCRWESTPQHNRSAAPVNLRAVAWRPLVSSEMNSGLLGFENCQFHCQGTSLMLGGAAKTLIMNNCLKSGVGSLLEISEVLSEGQIPQIRCQHVTLRQADALVQIEFSENKSAKPVELAIQAENCVFELRKNAVGLLTLNSKSNPRTRIKQLSVLGQILLVAADVPLVRWWNPETNQSTAVDLPGTIEGVMSYAIRFPGEDATSAAQSVIDGYQGPRWNSVDPGIRAAELNSESATIR